jgi:hypothetical protein
MNPTAFPSFDQFPQGMDFLKQFWAHGANASGAPSSAQSATVTPAFQQAMGHYLMPTLDLEELDKRMMDLRTVLQFMDLNTNMLRQSLNALEVQRNTLETLKSMAQPQSQTHTTDHTNPSAPWIAAWQSMLQGAQAVAPVKPSAETVASKKPNAKKTSVKKAGTKKASAKKTQ